jgi:phenylalanyl-tRNA synthetase beta chain
MESSADRLIVLPPTWRADLSREIDLIEEVARIHGYDAIPEDVDVPLGVAVARPRDLMLDRVRHVLSAYGIDEAMTASVVSDSWERFGSVWTSQPPLATETPLLVGARHLRRTLLPSLLACRHANQAQTIRNAQLYEVANIYLAAPTAEELPSEESVLALITQGDLQFVKGIVEEIVAQVAGKQPKVRWLAESHPCFEEESLQRLVIDDILVGFVGLISESVQQSMSLDQSVAAAELRVDALARLLVPVRRAEPVSLFPAIARDLNFIVDEQIQWKEICDGCQQAGGQLLQDIRYRETYRDTSKDGLGKKRILMTLHFQSLERTLTSEEIDLLVASVIQACAEKFQAKLLG